MLKKIIKEAIRVKATYEKLYGKFYVNDITVDELINYIYEKHRKEITIIEEYCNLIGKLIGAYICEYNIITNEFRYEIKTKEGYKHIIITID